MTVVRIAIALVSLLGSVVCASPAGAQSPSDATAACKNGGYVKWTDATGRPFRNEGQCVQYVARGNALRPVAPPPSLVVEQLLFTPDGYLSSDGQPVSPSGGCQFDVLAYNFPDTSLYTLQFYGSPIPVPAISPRVFPNGGVIYGVGWLPDNVVYHVYVSAYDTAGNLVATSPTQDVYCPTA